MEKQSIKRGSQAGHEQARALSAVEIRKILATCERKSMLFGSGDVLHISIKMGLPDPKIGRLPTSEDHTTSGWLTISSRAKAPCAGKSFLRQKAITAMSVDSQEVIARYYQHGPKLTALRYMSYVSKETRPPPGTIWIVC